MNNKVYKIMRGCIRKKKYKTEQQARSSAGQIQGGYYFCGCCGCWHITKQRDEK